MNQATSDAIALSDQIVDAQLPLWIEAAQRLQQKGGRRLFINETPMSLVEMDDTAFLSRVPRCTLGLQKP